MNVAKAMLGSLLLAAACGAAETIPTNAPLALLPLPLELRRDAGALLLGDAFALSAPAALRAQAELLASALRAETGLPVPVRGDGEPAALRIERGGGEAGAEGYLLTVRPDGATIRAAEPAGCFYAGQTLLQLLAPARPAGWQLPCVTIADKPRFAWRGLMLDCSRTFQSLEYVRQTIDRISFYKMNVLHLHLTDDQGWRLEIKRYPELTAKGARFAEKYNEPAAHEGFYTQEQMRELVRYAAARGVTLVPEIELPGHCLAALACYPDLSCSGGPFEIFPFFKGPGILRDVYCAGNDRTLAFLREVLDEVLTVFPSAFIHVGGDEVPKDRWKACAKCQARMRAEGLKNEHELQSWFIRQMDAYLAAKGRTLIGWDEILEGGLAPRAAVMSWRGMQGGIAAATAGHAVVMSPTSHCYFDYTYAAIDTQKAYAFEPVPAQLDAAQARHILGLQANFWSHIDREPERVDRQLFPRLLAIAERGWSAPAVRDWSGFEPRLQAQVRRLQRWRVALPDEATFRRIGAWTPAGVTEAYAPLTFCPTGLVAEAGGVLLVKFRYTRGAHRLGIESVALLRDGHEVTRDAHRGVTGAADADNIYRLPLPPPGTPGARYEIVARVRSEGGTDSHGEVWLGLEPKEPAK